MADETNDIQQQSVLSGSPAENTSDSPQGIQFEDILPWGVTGGDTGLSSRLKLKRNFEKIKTWIDSRDDPFFEQVQLDDGRLCVRLKTTFAGLYAEGFLSALGTDDQTGSGGSADGVLDTDALWLALAAATSEQVNASHLSDALAPYALAADIPVVPDWAMMPLKPSYTWDEISGKPSVFTPDDHDHDGHYAPFTHTHTVAQVDGLTDHLRTIDEDIDSLMDTAGELGTLAFLNTVPSHTHDDRYYTETEVDGKVSVINSALSLLDGRVSTLEDYWAVDAEGNLYTTYNVYSTRGVSALGTGSASGQSGTGGLDADALWLALAAATSEQVNASHLANALAGCLKASEVSDGAYMDVDRYNGGVNGMSTSDSAVPTSRSVVAYINDQQFLTDHQPLKTVNGQSLVGSGNITIAGGTTPNNGTLSVKANNVSVCSFSADSSSDVTLNIAESQQFGCLNIGNGTSGRDVAVYGLADWRDDVDGAIDSLTDATDSLTDAIGGLGDGAYMNVDRYNGGVNGMSTSDSAVPTSRSVVAYINDQGFLTDHQSLAGYATQSWVTGKGYATQSWVTAGYLPLVGGTITGNGDALTLSIGNLVLQNGNIDLQSGYVDAEGGFRISSLNNAGDYVLLADGSYRLFPTVPTINSGHLYIQVSGTTRKTFTNNQSSNTTVNFATGTNAGTIAVGGYEVAVKGFADVKEDVDGLMDAFGDLGSLAYKSSLTASDIPDLAASKITSGTFDAARIPSLAASKITSGTFDAARIPSLDASKITSGTLNINRIPDLSGKYATLEDLSDYAKTTDLGSLAYKSSLTASDIPSLAASKITSGTFDAARIPSLDASKITSGTLNINRIPDLSSKYATLEDLSDYVLISGLSDSLTGYSRISNGTIYIGDNSITPLTHRSFGNASVDGESGSFTFSGHTYYQSGYDYVGLQVGDSLDKWQLIAIDSLKWRQNDNGGTNTTWGSWRTLVDSQNISSYLTDYATHSWVDLYYVPLTGFMAGTYQGLGTCSGSGTSRSVSLSGYTLETLGIVRVKFTYANSASQRISINSKGYKYVLNNGVNIAAGVISAGSTATLIYDGEYYHLIGVGMTETYTASQKVGVRYDGTTYSIGAVGIGELDVKGSLAVGWNATVGHDLTVANSLQSKQIDVNETVSCDELQVTSGIVANGAIDVYLTPATRIYMSGTSLMISNGTSTKTIITL